MSREKVEAAVAIAHELLVRGMIDPARDPNLAKNAIRMGIEHAMIGDTADEFFGRAGRKEVQS
jgi:hypothetical protein